MIPALITSPDDAGFQQSLCRCRRQGSDWHMCRDTFGGHTKVIVITMVFRERPRHGGVAASNWATRRHSQRIKQASPNPSITYLRSCISCCLSLINVVCDLIIASCLLFHTGKMACVLQRLAAEQFRDVPPGLWWTQTPLALLPLP